MAIKNGVYQNDTSNGNSMCQVWTKIQIELSLPSDEQQNKQTVQGK